MSVRKPQRQQSAFTLIEMMIVLIIMGVILSLSAPSMWELLQKNRMQSAVDNFFAGLMFARSEALKRNQPVVICKSSSGTACPGTGNWEQGWMLFADQDADGVKDANEPILRVGEALHNGYTLRVSGSAFANQLTYRKDGSSSGASGSETFVFCGADQDVSKAREILVTLTGRPKRQLKTSGTCPI